MIKGTKQVPFYRQKKEKCESLFTKFCCTSLTNPKNIQIRCIDFHKEMVYNYKKISVLKNWQCFLSQVQLQFSGLKRTAPEQNTSFIAGQVKASTLLIRTCKGKADV